MSPEPDFELHEAPLDDAAAHPVPPISWRVIALGALALALVIAGIASIPQRFTSKTPAAVHPPPPTETGEMVTSVGVTMIGANSLPPGWNYTKPTGAHAIARSVDGRVRYACGRADSQNISLNVSHDGGESWSQLSTIISGATCSLTLNAAHPELIAVATNVVDREPTPAQCWQSQDGGNMLSPITLPDGAACSGSMQWLGTTLFIGKYQGPMVSATAKTHLVAKSTDGGPTTWVTGIDRFAAADFAFVGVAGATLYVRLTPSTAGGTTQVRSADGGSTWQPATFTINQQPLTLVSVVPGTTVWLAQTQTQLYASSDGGKRWEVGPTLPTGVSLPYYGGYVTPDGTLVTQFVHNSQSDPAYQIYATNLGDAAPQDWQPLAAQTQDVLVQAIDWDAHGHLTTLYSADGNGMLITYAV
ncbi:MAG: exo-alpha-sialidase [Ktedonobacterales bacterium]|nr:exo-alpha-sialidase [Ktedonobacterales bacterium]